MTGLRLRRPSIVLFAGTVVVLTSLPGFSPANLKHDIAANHDICVSNGLLCRGPDLGRDQNMTNPTEWTGSNPAKDLKHREPNDHG